MHLYLCRHISAIQEIVYCAQHELDLENRFYSIEEEWSEAILLFRPYKSHDLLDKENTLSLLERLENARTLLATMLMSKHISPLREEASQWAIKLASIADVLQQVSTLNPCGWDSLCMVMELGHNVIWKILNLRNFHPERKY